MMKNMVIISIAALVVWVFGMAGIYLLGAGAVWSFDPGTWPGFIRAVLAGGGLLYSIYVAKTWVEMMARD